MEIWIPFVVAGLIVLSVGYELWSGTARVRGFGDYERRTRPWLYWAALVTKLLLAAMAISVGMVIQWSK